MTPRTDPDLAAHAVAATKLLTVEVVYLDEDSDFDPYLAKMARPRDLRFCWQGVGYRRAVIRQGEPEALYTVTILDKDETNVRLEIYGRADEAYDAFQDGLAELPPLERFVFLLPRAPSGAAWNNPDAWKDPELVEHEVLA